MTGPDGSFSVELPAGGYVAVASAEGYESESLTGNRSGPRERLHDASSSRCWDSVP